MRRLIKIALVALGIRAFLRWRKRRRAEAAIESTPPPSVDPAAELRQKLADSRAEDDAVASEEPAEASVADRRADVHAEGRATVDEMTSSDEA